MSNQRDEAIDFLENIIPDDIRKKIEEKLGSFSIDVDEGYQEYGDFDGTVEANIISDDTDEVVGEIDFLVEQNSFTMSEYNEMLDAHFDDFVKDAKVEDYEIY